MNIPASGPMIRLISFRGVPQANSKYQNNSKIAHIENNLNLSAWYSIYIQSGMIKAKNSEYT